MILKQKRRDCHGWKGAKKGRRNEREEEEKPAKQVVFENAMMKLNLV